jgi:glycosyltransferase involved in cell wall biosynthesis
MFAVIIPVYNHERFLLPCVLSALSSPLVSEVHVMDDGSSDGSARLLNALSDRRHPALYNHTLVPPRNQGAHACLNALCEHVQSDWIAVLNSDDMLIAGRFLAAQQALSLAPADFLFGQLIYLDRAGRVRGLKRGPLDYEYPYPNGLAVERLMADANWLDLLANQNFILTTSNMIFTKRLWEKIGGFRPFRYIHDWDFALRACVLGTPQFVPLPLTAYRYHPGNTIKESVARVNDEVRACFAQLLNDFAGLRERPLFRMALSGNQYLASEADRSIGPIGPIGSQR